MELPCTLVFAYNFWYKGGPQSHKFVPRLMGCIFTMHYIYRGWIFPYNIRVHNVRLRLPRSNGYWCSRLNM